MNALCLERGQMGGWLAKPRHPRALRDSRVFAGSPACELRNYRAVATTLPVRAAGTFELQKCARTRNWFQKEV